MDDKNYIDIISISIRKPIVYFLFSAVRMTEYYILNTASVPKDIKGRE